MLLVFDKQLWNLNWAVRHRAVPKHLCTDAAALISHWREPLSAVIGKQDDEGSTADGGFSISHRNREAVESDLPSLVACHVQAAS